MGSLHATGALCHLGIFIYLISLSISTWAMLVNVYFEGTVRLQRERNHQVVSTGPYGLIRHPGNLAMLLSPFVQPLIIGFKPVFLLCVISAILVLLRTELEDALLQKELDGYEQYARQVKYKLVPKIW